MARESCSSSDEAPSGLKAEGLILLPQYHLLGFQLSKLCGHVQFWLVPYSPIIQTSNKYLFEALSRYTNRHHTAIDWADIRICTQTVSPCGCIWPIAQLFTFRRVLVRWNYCALSRSGESWLPNSSNRSNLRRRRKNVENVSQFRQFKNIHDLDYSKI